MIKMNQAKSDERVFQSPFLKRKQIKPCIIFVNLRIHHLDFLCLAQETALFMLRK